VPLPADVTNAVAISEDCLQQAACFDAGLFISFRRFLNHPFALCIQPWRIQGRRSTFSEGSALRGDAENDQSIVAGKSCRKQRHCRCRSNQISAEAVKKETIKPSSHTSVCPWKGTAHYYHVEVNGFAMTMPLVLPEPKPAAAEIKDVSRSGRRPFEI